MQLGFGILSPIQFLQLNAYIQTKSLGFFLVGICGWDFSRLLGLARLLGARVGFLSDPRAPLAQRAMASGFELPKTPLDPELVFQPSKRFWKYK